MKKLLLAIAVSIAVISLPVFSNAIDGDTDVGSDEKNVNEDADHDWDWVDTDSLGYINLAQDGEVNEGEPEEPVPVPVPDPDPDPIPDPDPNTYMWRAGVSSPGVVLAGEDFDWGQTQTTFRAQITTTSDLRDDDGVLKLRQNHRMRIASELMVDEGDVGEPAQCLVVAGYSNQVGGAEPEAFMLSDDGWASWKGSLSDLKGMECVLTENHKIIAHDGELFPGEFKLFFGYLLGNGKLVYGPKVLSLTVE